MALNIGRLKGIDTELDSNTSLVFAAKISEEMDFRILPPTEGMEDGLYFTRRKLWWINKKPYLSNATFGEDDVIQMQIDAAKKLKDADLNELIGDSEKLALREDFLIPIVQFNSEFDNAGNCTKLEVAGKRSKLFVIGKQLLSSINKQVTSKFCQPDITDLETGFNLVATKTGSGKNNTEYASQAWPKSTALDPATFGHTVICPVEFLQDEKLSDTYLIGVIRNYLYGERMPDEVTKKSVAPAVQRKTRAVVPADEIAAPETNTVRAAAPEQTQRRAIMQAEIATPVQQEAQGEKLTAAPVTGKRRSLLDSVQED